jgi:tetratricopeptide (TPR) repeat protein/serine/threonine protein kinase
MTGSRPDNEAIFHAAREISDPDRRHEYVRGACGGDQARIAQVVALLAAAEGPDSLLDRPAAAIPVATIDQPTTENPGAVIGPYKLIEQIGEGGMGTVWMAQQTEPVKRAVAVKLIKSGMDSKQVLARFEAERQALALMDHPNIARVLDAGATTNGRPYFVMELVKGVPITKYCDDHRLTPTQRLELFLPVCQAIQHAHHKGIIHRDIKPTNILVAQYDGRPVPKVIDFGVAKAAGQQLTDKTLMTGFGSVVGTLEYMSPEQAELNQLDIDTRSDIYSLGVVLYELLTGSTPLDKKRLQQAAFAEILRVIREEEPQKPSTRLSHSTDSLPSVSAQRQMEPAKLTRLLRGELDWIVMKALEKDRNRRYETANGFAMDVQRYLADEPVLACPPSAGYRLRKFVRRNKGTLAATALGLFFLVILGSGVGWVVRDRSARKAEAARQQRERQTKVAGTVESVFAEVDRLEKEQKWPEAMEAARRAAAAVAGGEADAATAERVQQRLRDLEFIDELERIRMERATLNEGKFNWAGADRDYARVFREYGVDVDALPVETSIDRLKVRPALAVPLAAALDDWVHNRRMTSEADTARWKRLVAVARGIDPEPLRDRLRAAWGQPVADVRDDLRRLADSIDVRAQQPATLFMLARTLRKGQLLDSELRILRAAQNLHPDDFWLNILLGDLLEVQIDSEEGIRFYTAAVAIRPRSALAHSILGLALIRQKRFDEAIAACRRATELDPKYFHAHHSLGFALHDKGLVDEAIVEYHKALELLPRNDSAYECSHVHNNLGLALADKGRRDEAMVEFKKAIELDPKNAFAHNNLGAALADKQRGDEAIAEYKKAIEIDSKYASPHDGLGNDLMDKGRVDEAITEYKKAIELDPKSAIGHYNLGSALRTKGLLDEGLAEHRKAVDLDPKDAKARGNLGNALADKGLVDEAIAEYRNAIKLDPKFANAYNGLGVALAIKGRVEEAIAELRKAIELDPNNASAHSNLGNALVNKRRVDEAIAEYRKSIKLDPKYVHSHISLGDTLRDQGKLEEALTEYRRAVDLVPKAAGAHIGLGNVLLDQRKVDEAIAEYRKGIELDPKNGDAHCNLGNVLYRQKKLDEAVACYKKAIELAPKNFAAHFNLGLTLQVREKWDEAIAEYRRAVEINPQYTHAHNNLGIVLCDRKHDYEGAVVEFRASIAIDPNDAIVHHNLGNALGNQGKLDDAIPEYRQAVALDPKYANAHYQLANLFARLGRWDEALAPMDKAAESPPADDPWYPYKTAALHLRAGDLAGYRRICREMLERFGDTKVPEVAELVAMTCLLMPDAVADRDRDRVLKLADWPLTRDVNNHWFQFGNALAEYRAGRHAEVVRWLERYAPRVSGSPGDASAFAVLALAQHQQGRREDALAALDQAERTVAAKLPDPAGGRPFGDDWYDWLHSQSLLGEAEKLLKPDEARLHFYRGSRRGGQGKWPEAEAEYGEAIGLRPDWYEAHYQLAVAIWEQGRQKDARAAFRDAERLKPKPPAEPPDPTLPASWSTLDNWVVKEQELYHLDQSHSSNIFFGDPHWADYDFEAEVEIIAGGSEVGLVFRATDRDDFLYAVIGGWGNTNHSILIAHKGLTGIGFAKGQSKKGRWYRLRIEARRERVKMFLDGKLLMTVDAGERLRGCVGLVTNPVHARFRNLKVTDATGKVLWEGVQNVLPKPKP